VEEKEKLASNIRHFIELSGKDVFLVAAESGVSRALVYHYMNARHIPNALILKKLCQSIGCTYEDLLGELT